MAGVLDSDGDQSQLLGGHGLPLQDAPEPSLRASLDTPLENNVSEPSQDILAESLDLALKETLRVVSDEPFENWASPESQDPLDPESTSGEVHVLSVSLFPFIALHVGLTSLRSFCLGCIAARHGKLIPRHPGKRELGIVLTPIGPSETSFQIQPT